MCAWRLHRRGCAAMSSQSFGFYDVVRATASNVALLNAAKFFTPAAVCCGTALDWSVCCPSVWCVKRTMDGHISRRQIMNFLNCICIPKPFLYSSSFMHHSPKHVNIALQFPFPCSVWPFQSKWRRFPVHIVLGARSAISLILG